jgi:hypothetical protein
MSLEEQLVAERERMWRRFAKSGFVVAFVLMALMGVLGLIFY